MGGAKYKSFCSVALDMHTNVYEVDSEAQMKVIDKMRLPLPR